MGASSDSPVATSPQPDQHEAAPEIDLAQALRELAKGEQTATAMEANLSNLESKLDALLAAFEPLKEEKGGNSRGEIKRTAKEDGGAPEQKSKPEEK